MPDLKISQFADGGTIQTTDEIATNRAGVNTKVFVGSAALADIGAGVGDVVAFGDDGLGNSQYPAGDGSLLTGISSSTISVTDAGGDTTMFVLLVGSVTGTLSPMTDAGISYNALTKGLNLSGTLSMGANSITMTGSLSTTGARVTKGWFTDIESTNVPTVGGVALPTASSTTTFTNKRITPRVSTTASSSTPTPNADTDDMYTVTALAAGATFGAPTGTPVNGQALIIRIKDNGTARTLAYNAAYRALGTVLPTTTVINKTIYLSMIYNSADSVWDVTGVAQQA